MKSPNSKGQRHYTRYSSVRQSLAKAKVYLFWKSFFLCLFGQHPKYDSDHEFKYKILKKRVLGTR